MEIIPGAKWGRVFRNTPPKVKPRLINELTIHYMGVDGPITEDPRRIPGLIKNIERNHMARAGENMSAIGYNFLIDKNGRIWEGRGWDFRNGANGTDSNDTSVSVCILVGIKDNKPTPEMVEAVRWLRAQVQRRYRRFLLKKLVTVRGHKDHKATSCPGPVLYKMIKNGTFMEPPAEA
jgi:hypothetical protein